MRLIQYYLPNKGRRVGIIDGKNIVDLTSIKNRWTHIYHLFFEAQRNSKTIERHLADIEFEKADIMSYNKLLKARPKDASGWILPPIDHPDPAHCYISGTGLTHLGSMEQRANMHSTITKKVKKLKTDSQKMFEMGIKGGKPELGMRGVQPEWFYKGSGWIMRGHGDHLDIPSFTEDGGEEPEIVGCYVIDDDGTPCRLGFAIGNEWSDHQMERMNYLWLAPSKLRVCSLGPELITDQKFMDVRGSCSIIRGVKEIYNSGVILTGQDNMSHSLANLEDHHFKHPHFRIPGDVHVHFFGTMKFSYPNRPNLQTGDRIEINFKGMGASLMNYVRKIPSSQNIISINRG